MLFRSGGTLYVVGGSECVWGGVDVGRWVGVGSGGGGWECVDVGRWVGVGCGGHWWGVGVCGRCDCQGFIQDFRSGGETQHLGGSEGMFPHENF